MKTFKQVLDDANKAHTRHIATQSYAEHVALGQFYADAREAADRFAESAIGLDIPAPEAEEDGVSILEEGLLALSEMRESECGDDPTLLAIFDDLTMVYTSTLYKLKRLIK